MSLMISIPGPLHLEGGGNPLYLIGGRGYNLETLQELPYETWSNLSSVGLEVPVDREWSCQPLLLTTTYGGIIVETKPGGEFKIVNQSSQRTLESAIVGIYKLAVPMIEGSTLNGAKLLSPADEETTKLFEVLREHRFTLSQYLGQSPVPMKRGLIPHEGIAVPQAWVPCFKDSSAYNRANVILMGRDECDRERAAVASYNSRSGRIEPPLSMKQ